MAAEALIINADDLGLWPAVDKGILHVWSQGAISDCTAFATAPHLPEALQAAADVSLPVGIHLNLTEGASLSDPAEIPDIVTSQGAFKKCHLWEKLLLPQEQIRAELRRQAQRVIDLGCKPSHLDCHHNIHRYPEIFSVVVELAQEYQLAVRAIDDDMRFAFKQAGVATPDHFIGTFYGEGATLKTLVQAVDSCPGGILEIMTHPGYSSDEVPSSYREYREQELQVLTSAEWHAYLEEICIPLVGYEVLASVNITANGYGIEQE